MLGSIEPCPLDVAPCARQVRGAFRLNLRHVGLKPGSRDVVPFALLGAGRIAAQPSPRWAQAVLTGCGPCASEVQTCEFAAVPRFA
jgi:hypothetical protein